MRIAATLAFGILGVLQPPAALAEVVGLVHEVVNPDAPRAEWRREPLPGAYVVLTWSIVIPAPAHAIDSCRHAEVARADAKGRYAMEGPGPLTAGLAKPVILAYAPGRERVAFPYPGSPATPADIAMVRSRAAPDERLSHMLTFESYTCGGRLHDPQRVLASYYEALAAEARALSPATEGGRTIQRLLEAKAKDAAALGAR